MFFSSKLNSIVKIKLFNSFCTIYYGCELSVSSGTLLDFCTTWQESLRRIWDLPPQTHGDFIRYCLNAWCFRWILSTVADFCSYRCLQWRHTSQYWLVFLCAHGLFYALLGGVCVDVHFSLYCSAYDLIFDAMSEIPNPHVSALIGSETRGRALFLNELIMITDSGMFNFTNNFSLSTGRNAYYSRYMYELVI